MALEVAIALNFITALVVSPGRARDIVFVAQRTRTVLKSTLDVVLVPCTRQPPIDDLLSFLAREGTRD